VLLVLVVVDVALVLVVVGGCVLVVVVGGWRMGKGGIYVDE